MFDSMNAIWAALTGKLSNHPQARKVAWVLMLAFMAGWLGALFAAWISFPSYLSLIDFLPDPEWKAMTFTTAIAGFLYFAIAYCAGFLIEKWLHIPDGERNYTALAFRIMAISGTLFLFVDFQMNMQGADVRSESAAGDILTYSYSSPSSTLDRISSDQSRLDEIHAGKLGGYGWRDPKTGIFHLNASGKRATRELQGSIRRAEQADSTAQAMFIADQTLANSRRNTRQATIQNTLRGAVYGVYVFIFLLSIVSSYCVEIIQRALADNPLPEREKKPGLFARMSSKVIPAPSPVTAERQAAGFKQGHHSSPTPPSSATVTDTPQNDMHGNRAGRSDRSADRPYRPSQIRTKTVTRDGYEITCKQCGDSVTMKSPKAVFCSDTCKKQHWKEGHPNKTLRV